MSKDILSIQNYTTKKILPTSKIESTRDLYEKYIQINQVPMSDQNVVTRNHICVD